MTSIATALASVSLLFAAPPAVAQMHAAGGGRTGGIQGAARVGGDAGRGGAHDGRAGHFGLRSNGLDDHRHWPYGGGFALGYGYPWYPEPSDDGDDEPHAYAPPTPPPDQPNYRRHDPNACAEWSWAAAKRRYICTRHAF